MAKVVKKKFKIVGMHCASCAMNIDFDLEDLNGVKSVKTSYASQTCEVELDPSKINGQLIVETIKKTGYDANPLET